MNKQIYIVIVLANLLPSTCLAGLITDGDTMVTNELQLIGANPQNTNNPEAVTDGNRATFWDIERRNIGTGGGTLVRITSTHEFAARTITDIDFFARASTSNDGVTDRAQEARITLALRKVDETSFTEVLNQSYGPIRNQSGDNSLTVDMLLTSLNSHGPVNAIRAMVFASAFANNAGTNGSAASAVRFFHFDATALPPPPPPVPEPATILTFGGLGLAVLWRRRRRHARSKGLPTNPGAK